MMDTSVSTANQTRVSENPPYNTVKSTRPTDKHEDRSRTSSHRSGRYKEKFHQMREKYDQATAKREEYLRDINIGEAKVRQLQAENDLLLDAMYIAIPMQSQSQSVERKPNVFNLAEFQPRQHQNGIPLALERSIPPSTSNHSDPNTPHHPNPNPHPNTNTNVISITNSNASPEPESIPVSGPVPPPLHPPFSQQQPQPSVSGSFPQQPHPTQTQQQPPGAPQQPPPPPQTQISLNIVNVPPSVARGAHFSPHPTHMNGVGSGSAITTANSTSTATASATVSGTASNSTDPTSTQPAAAGRRRTSQRHGRLKFVSHDANGRIA